MPLHVAPLLESDIPAFAHLDDLAMADWGLARAMTYGASAPRRELVEGMLRAGWGKDPAQRLLKVVDGETGEMVAGAMWRVQTERGEGELDLGGAATGQGEGSFERVEGGDWVEVAKPSVMATMARQWEAFRRETFGAAPHAHLQILVTSPSHQRRGAGTMLVQWGCARADELGIVAVLTASEAGLKVYERAGFVVVKEYGLDLRPWGVEEVEVRRAMIRQPRGGV